MILWRRSQGAGGEDDAHQDVAGCPQRGEMRSRREVEQEVCKKTGIMGLRPLAPVGPGIYGTRSKASAEVQAVQFGRIHQHQ